MGNVLVYGFSITSSAFGLLVMTGIISVAPARKANLGKFASHEPRHMGNLGKFLGDKTKKEVIFALAGIAGIIFGPLTSCAKETINLTPVPFSALSHWEKDDHLAALKTMTLSCRDPLFPEKRILPTHHPIIAERLPTWGMLCPKLATIKTKKQARIFIETHLTPYAVTTEKSDSGLFTGYFETTLKASRKPSDVYRYPIYKRPSDLKDNTPYLTRKEIMEGALKDKHLELFWVADPVALFFLHVQGSGQLVLTDGTILRVGFDGKNHQPYVAIGRTMLERGMLEKDHISAASITNYLHAHPQSIDTILSSNPSYIFFKVTKGNAPKGAQGVPLTAMRSLAIDKTMIPYGAMLWVDTTLTKTPHHPATPFTRLMIAQDTGSAIEGVIRGDIFFGSGEKAAEHAGFQKDSGRYYLLLPKE